MQGPRLAVAIALFLTPACYTLRPKTVLQDRFNDQESLSRSRMELSAGVDVPADHLEHSWTRKGLELDEDAPALLMTIRSATERPDDAYCAVRIRDHWFCIDESDLHDPGRLIP